MSHRLFVVAVMSIPVLAMADAPGDRYTITNGGTTKGTVYDRKTNLTWQQAVPTTRYNWEDAKTYCAQAGVLLAGSGWRLPTVKELRSIVDYSRIDPAIDTTAFPLALLDSYFDNCFWSSSPSASSAFRAWTVYFGYGKSNDDARSTPHYVRCVR